MVQQIDKYTKLLQNYDWYIPEFQQTVSEETLIKIIGQYDAWIAGDDPATRKVLQAGTNGNLKVLIKWGIGTDNIDIPATKELGISFTNTPGMFGDEVADVAIGYLIGLTRCLFSINEKVKQGKWSKPAGMSLQGKKTALVGFGDIGRNIASRLLTMGCDVYVSDPGFRQLDTRIVCKYNPNLEIDSKLWNVKLTDLDSCLSGAKIVILSCPYLKSTHHLINNKTLDLLSDKCYIVNVSRGPIVNEKDYQSLQVPFQIHQWQIRKFYQNQGKKLYPFH
jgi:D-3-phosphoglycerate dehydrogenase